MLKLIMAVLLLPLLAGYYFISNKYYGIVVIFFVYYVGFSIFYISKHMYQLSGLSRDVAIRFISSLKDKAQKIIITYILISTSIVSSFSGSYSSASYSAKTLGDKFSSIVPVVDLAGEILFVLLLPIIIISIIVDKFVQRATGYERKMGGYLDPVTNEPNVSLRYTTFGALISSSNDSEKIGEKTGIGFATVLQQRFNYRCTESDLTPFDSLILKWIESDEKAGWFEHMYFQGDDCSQKELVYVRSFAQRLRRHCNNDNACKFLLGYSKGILSIICPEHEVQIALREQTCVNCRKGNNDKERCYIDVSLT